MELNPRLEAAGHSVTKFYVVSFVLFETMFLHSLRDQLYQHLLSVQILIPCKKLQIWLNSYSNVCKIWNFLCYLKFSNSSSSGTLEMRSRSSLLGIECGRKILRKNLLTPQPRIRYLTGIKYKTIITRVSRMIAT